MSEAVPMDLMIADLEISEISDTDLEAAFRGVLVAHKDAVASIHQSMRDADDAYRKYLNPDYIPLEDVAKDDRAILNKAEKNIAEKYADLKEAYEKPLRNVEVNIREIRKAIKDASGVVDKKVKTYEETRKSKKREEIQAYFNTKKFDLVPLDRIFDEKWLNKTTKMKDIREEIDAKIAVIYRDIEILEKIPNHGMAAKAFYLEKLDMGAALRQVDILKENAERLAREQAAREERKVQEQCDRNAAAERQERRNLPKDEIIQSMVDEALDLPHGTTATQAKNDILEYTATFKGTEEQLRNLREYMTANGIAYTRALLLESEEHARQMARARGVEEDVHYLIYVPAAA